MKREIVSLLKARTAVGGEVTLPTGAIIDDFHVVRRSEPSSDTYLAGFHCEQGELTCPLYAFLPRTRIVEVEPALPVAAAIA